MAKELLADWDRSAREAANRLSAALEMSAPHDLELTNVPADGADGNNGLDEDFVAKVEAREHLTDDFLKDA